LGPELPGEELKEIRFKEATSLSEARFVNRREGNEKSSSSRKMELKIDLR
jgi:hypothetical protein